jgi:class 3 adenylate cyclase/predicted ATPase
LHAWADLGAIMDVGAWLRSLGLERYEAAFSDNEIDAAVLPSLTADDLKDLGIGIVGHRRKLLDAIAALRADVSAKPAPPDPLPVTDRTAKDAAERRQVTVMFSDLVGSTALSARMDPEDLREVIAAYHKCTAEIVRRFGGFVSQYLGDGVLVYFGYPQAHEDDAERAVRAGLELVEAVARLNTRVSLQTRVGIATGVVVVGDLVDAGGSQERGIIGETPNLAARLQGFAEPNTVVMAESTRKLLGSLFELKDLGAKELKGIDGSVHVWGALRARSVESRFEALHASDLTALVGREEESELLLRRWARAKNGEGQVALLSGEAGIGKSRLTAALLENVAAKSHIYLRYFCSPQHTDSALYPIIGQMERAAGLAHADSTQTRLNKLDALLAQTSTSSQDAALLAEMLSLAKDDRYPKLELTPEQRRQRTLEALITQINALSRASPVLMIFEDVHWIDPTSLEALGRVVDWLRTARLLLIVTFRPEFDPPWIGRSYVTALTINRLGQRDTEAMIERVVGNKLLPANIRQDIIERTDGIPLFVEEMTKAVLEAEGEGEAQQAATAVTSPALAVPPSLHASLMARLDRLGPAKEVAQIGAAIGREFSHTLLAASVGKPEPELSSALDRLIQSGLLFRQGLPPHASYLFKHALVQDTAYTTLLREPRRALHARIADVLQNQFAEITESQPELLARHYTEAGLIEKAADFWGKAGQRSLVRSALVEAVEQLTRASDQIATLPSTPTLRREQIKLQVALINALFHVKGYAAPETKAAAEQARTLIEQAEALGEAPEDPLLLFSVLYGFWVANLVAFNSDVCCDLSTQFLSLAEKQAATVPLMIGHHIVGISLLSAGGITEGRAHYDQAISLYNPVEHRPLATRFGQDSRVVMLSRRSAAMWLLGYPEAAVADAERAVRNARQIGHAATLMYALSHGLFARYECGNYTSATAAFDELIDLAGEKGTLFWKAFGMMNQGCVYALTSRPSDAVRMITSGLGARQSTGSTMWMPFFMAHLARAHIELGKFEDARHWLGKAITVVETTKERWCEAEVYRIAGEIALLAPEPETAKAEEYFARALAVARHQQAKSWELRAAISIARLWRDQGKRGQAHSLLAPVYDWFTEGFDTADLKEAKTLLDALVP